MMIFLLSLNEPTSVHLPGALAQLSRVTIGTSRHRVKSGSWWILTKSPGSLFNSMVLCGHSEERGHDPSSCTANVVWCIPQSCEWCKWTKTSAPHFWMAWTLHWLVPGRSTNMSRPRIWIWTLFPKGPKSTFQSSEKRPNKKKVCFQLHAHVAFWLLNLRVFFFFFLMMCAFANHSSTEKICYKKIFLTWKCLRHIVFIC